MLRPGVGSAGLRIWITGVLALALGACNELGFDDPDPTATRRPRATEAPETATSAATPTDERPAPTPTPEVAPTPSQRELAEALLRGILGAGGEEECAEGSRTAEVCITLQSNERTVGGGIAAFNVTTLDGGAYTAVMAERPDRAWGFWLVTQNAYQLLFLPADIRICTGGDVLNVRPDPSIINSPVSALQHGALAAADRFVLTEPGTPDIAGAGWYHIAGPVEGWVYSRFTSNALLGNCDLRDAQEP